MLLKVILPLVFAASSAAAAPCKSVLAQDDLRLWQCDRLKVLVARGTPVERAEKMGRLLGRELSRKPMDLFADILLSPFHDAPIKGWFVDKALGIWTWMYDRSAPKEYHEELAALAAGAEVPGARVRRALLFPDAALWLWAGLDDSGFLGFGCTSGSRRFADGRFVYGRNLDFPGVGAYDAHPLVFVSLPKPGSSELKHVAFGADGMPFGGITGFNEAGIGFAVHQNYTKDVTLGGTPMPYIGELVLRSARSIDEAVAVIKKHRPGPLWTFLLTDLKSGEILVIEASRKHFAVRGPENNLSSQSNHSFHDSVRVDELIDVGTKVNSVLRSDRMLELLAAVKGEPAAAVAAALADQREASGDLSVHADIIKPLTIQSVILESRKGGVWATSISIDEAPSSSGRFATFTADSLWSALDAKTLDAEIRVLSGTPADKRAKQVKGAQAFAALMEPNGLDRSLELLKDQTSVGALLARSLLQNQQGRSAEAIALAVQARGAPSFPREPVYMRQAIDWAELAALHASGRTEESKARAKALIAAGIVDPRFRHFAEDVAEGRTPDEIEAKPGFDFFSGYQEYTPLKPAQWKDLDARALRAPL